MDTALDAASVVLFVVLIMYAAIKLDEAASLMAAYMKKSGFTVPGGRNE